MIGKNNKYLKDTRNGVKVESYSIKKFKVGAASVVIGASIFFGAGAVAQASEEVSNHTTADNTTNAGAKENVPTAPVATTQPVAKETTKKEDVAAGVAAKLGGETAKEVKALDKTKLENYIAEIEAKLADGTYANKTEESVAVLKEALKVAKDTLENATTQDEIKKAYNKLVTTANTKLKNKPVEKKETPAVDTTNGQLTVGKKAENTEKKSESNSIENTGSNDSRNGKALDKNNAFRAEVAYSEGTNAAANGHSDTYILNDVNKATTTDDAVNAVSRVTNYKVKYNKDASGKITSLDWLVFYNDHAENLSNKYNTDGGDVYRNFIQIPAEVNMPTSITRAKYNSPVNGKLNPKTKRLERIKPDGSALSNAVTFENPAPATAAGLPLDKKDSFSLASGWESGIYGRSIEKLAGQEDRYFKSAASNSSPRTKELVYGAALNDKRLIVDRSTTGGDGNDAYAWSFRTEVPKTTTNEQLKDMKVVFGMMRSATAGANAGFANIATNPIKMWKSDVYTPTAKDQTVKVGQKPDATKSIGNLDTLPKGTTVKYKDAVDTRTPGEKRAIAVVTYPDTSTKEVPVKVIVEKEKEAVAPAKPVTPQPATPKPSTPAPGAATNKPAAGAATSGPEIVNDLAGKASTPADVTVKAPAGSTVKLYNTDGVVIGEAVANAQGVATVHPTNSLPAGKITATSTPTGGKESAKSTPITITASPVTVKDGGVTGNDDTRLLVSRSEITVYPGDKIDVDVVAQATALEKFSVEKNPLAIRGVEPTGGYLGASNGATIRQRDAKYSGTVAMDQPAGETVVTFYAKNRDHGTNVSRDLKVIVLETAKKYEPVAGTKVDIVDSNGVSGAEKNKIIEAVKAANPSLPANSQYSVDEKGNLTITYPDGSKDKIAAAYLVNPGADAATSAPEIVNDLAGKASTPADVTVKAPAGSTVKLYNTDGVVIGEAVANAQGVATVHPTNSLPAGKITATSTPTGGKESAKSTPITITASPVTVKDGGVTGNDDTRLLVSRSEITVYPGDKIDVDVVAQATALEKFSVEKNPLAIRGVEPTGGYLGASNGATIRQRDAKYSGTVAMDQPAGETVVTFYAKNRDHGTNVSRDLKVIVLETAKKYEPVAGTKLDVANSNNLSEDDKNKVIASVKAANPSLPANSQYSVDEKGNLTITYPDGSKDKIAAAYLVNPAPTDADKNTPTAKPQTVNKGTTPKAEDSIGNIKDLPKGTKVAFKAPVDTATPGEKDATVVVTYPDGSNEEVPVKVTVKAPSSASTTPTAPATPAAPVVAPTVEIPYSNKDTKEVYVYAGEENSFDIKFKDDSGKIASATVRQGGNKAFADVAGEANTINTQYGFKANVINAETPATEKAPAVITYSGTPAATDGLAKDKLEAATKGENPEGMALGWRYATATDKDGAFIENKAVGSSTATDPGAFRVMLKGQTQKYDIATPTEKVTVADPANVTDADLAKIKEKLQLEYSQNNDDANLADKKGQAVADKDAKIQSVTKDDKGNLVVTYKDGSQDKKPLSEFVTKKPTDADKNESPSKPEIKTDLTGKAGTKTPVEVTATPGSKVELFDKDGNKIGEGVAGKDGKATITPTKELPAGDVTAKETTPAGKVSEASTPAKATPTKDTTTPSKPEIKTDLTGKAGTKTPVEVTATPGSKVELFDKDGNKIGEGVAGKDGKATITPTKELPAGDVTAKETTPAGKVSEASTPAKATPTKDTTTPSKPEIKTDLTGKAGTKTPVEVTATPGSKVELFDKDGNKIGEGVAGKDGKATITPTKELPAGDVTAKETTPAGKVSEASTPAKATPTKDTTTPSKPEIKTDLTGKAGTKTPVEVTATPGSKVELFDKDGNKIGEGVAGKDGKATITPTKELPAGDVTAKETTPAGKVSEASTPAKATPTKDTTTPSKPEIKTDLTGKAGTKTPVEVTATPGSKVELFDKDGNKIGEGVAGKDGKATITPTKELPAGDVTAKETTPAGKVSEASTPAKATPTKDTTTPSKPEIKTDLTGKAGTKTPVEVTATPGSKVELFDKDGNKIGEGVAGKDGKATITPTKELPAGDVTAKETTPAGKVSEASTPAKATPTKDTTTPSKPEIKTDLTGKAGTKTPVEVTATPGSKVELFDKDGNKIGEGVAGKDGKATITPTKELPAGDVTAKETTPAGKVSEASTPAKATPTKDTTTPSKPEIKTDLTGKAGTKTPVEVTATPGSKVELFDKDGNKIGEGVAGKDGKATITPTKELPAGDVTAKATDSAGNVSQPSAPEKATEDTKAPSKPEIKTDLTDKAGTKTPVEVTAEPGSKVELFDKDGNKIGEGVAGKDGKATITPTKELPAGDVTAKATDPAGNVSEPSAPEKATEDTKAPSKPEIKTDLTDKAGTKTPVEVTAEPGSKVELFDKDGNKIGEGVAGKDGKATITPTKELPAGDVTAKATDSAGNVSQPSAPEKATEDTKAPSKPEIKTDLTDKAGTKTPVEVTAEPGSKVELFDKDGNKIGEGVAGKDGKATITPTKELPAGDVTAKATDSAGNVSQPSAPEKATEDTKAPAKPEIKTDLTDKAGTKTPVEVTAEPGSKVELFDKDGNKIGEGVADENGKATITPTKELPAGDVTAKATDPAGNVSQPSAPEKATEDTKAPAKPEIKTDLTDKAGTKTPVEVTAEPGSKVELFDKDGNKIGEGVADENGKATITPTVELPAGDVTAKATDPAGNVSEPSSPEKATEDTKAPAKPEIKTDLTDKAGTKTPVEVTAEPGSKVELFDKDGNKIGEGVADENGKATITPTKELPAGDVTAKATDPAGNVSEPSSPEKATEDTKAPAKPEIKTDLTDKAGTKTPVEVTAEPGSKVELFDKDGNKIGEGVADENGKATITPTVELPAGDVTAKATDPAGNVSQPSSPEKATEDTKAPAKPEIKTDLTDKAGTKTPVEVTAEPGSKVELFDKDGNKIGEGVAGKDGKATITPTKELPAGDVTAKATDSAGNVSQPSAPEKATEDTKAPSKPEIKTDLTDKAGTKTPVEVTAEPGSKVELFDKDGNKIGEGVAGKDGKATITPTKELPAGDVTAKATDPAGNVSEPSAPEKATEDTKAPSKPEIKTDLTDKAGTKTPVEVTAEPGSKVELFDKDGNKIGEGVAGKDGKATITPTKELPAGDVTAKATDSAGNVSQPSAPEKATEDTKAPSKPEIKTDLTDKAGTKTPVEVTAEPGSKVELFDKDGNKIGEGVAGKDGKATITPTKELPAGDVTAKATDSAGNVSQPSAPEKATEDTKAPAKPEIKTDLTDKAGTKTPVEVTAEPGSKVELFDKDGNKIGEGVADENGKATITPTKELPAGDVTAKATDPAGNVSQPSAPEKATEDTKAPAKPEIKTDLTDKAGTKTPVEVTAEPGSKVELFDKDGNKIGEGVADENGKATITPTVELPAGDVTAKATDPAGNVSEPSSPEKATEDTKAPAKPEIKTDLTDKAGTKTPVEVTAEPGSKVELFDKDGNKIGEGVADENGKATITPTKELPAGDVTAKATDPAGNVSEPSSPEKATEDTKAPAKPEIKTDLTDKAGTKTPVEVTAEPGSKVELFDKDGNKIGEGVADENGKATITPTKELPAGDVTAKATDPAGNVSEPSSPEKATEDTKAPAKPEIKTDLTDKAGTKTPVEVTAEPGSKVELFDKDGNKIGEGVADENGKATITPTKELPAGDVTAKATDPAGNVSEPSAPEKATEDTKAPSKPEIKTDLTDKAGTKTPVEVTAEPGSKVELFDKDGNKIGEGVAGKDGKATITPTKELPAGDVTAKATDSAGNVSQPSAPEKATEDTKAPSKPEIKTDLTDKAGTKTPVEVTAEPGSKVELFDKDGNKIGEGVAGKDGKATITPTKELPAGDVTAKATDSAGNVSQPSAPAKATEDTKAPAKPEIKTDLTDKAGTKTPVEVTAEPGSKVELFDKDGNKIGEGVADENGKATITPTKKLPAGEVIAKATDPAGNVSEASTPAKATEDTKAPAKPEIKTDLTDKAGTKTPVEVTAEPGSKVELFDKDGNKIGEGVADENGKATITPTKKLPAGEVIAKATDPAGNVSETSTPAKATEDTKAPAKPEIKTDLTDKAGTKTPVEVTAEPGSKVELFDKDGHKLGEGVADENGKATITPTKELPDGGVIAKATDPAGNVSQPSEPAKATTPAKPNAGNDINTPADKAVVKDPAKLTDEEKAKVKKAVEDVNPGSKVVVDDKGNATVTTPEGKTATIPGADVTKSETDAGKANAGNDIVKPAAKTEVKDPANLTPEEKKAIEDKVKAVNPGSKVVVDDKGNATVTTPEGKTAVIPATDVTKSETDAGKANAGNDINTPADKAVVKDPANLTPEEKKAIEDKVKAVNPGSKVVVDDKGNATVTTPEGKTAVIPATDVTKSETDAGKANAGNDIVKPADKTAVTNPDKLTDAEKKAIEDKVKAVNPGSKVVVDDKGNATVTTPEGKTAVIPAADVTKSETDAGKANAGNDINTPAAKTEVKDPAKLTDEEKAKVKKAVEDVNPGSKVVVDDKGNATVTTPEGKTAVIPATDVTKSETDAGKANAGNDINTPATRVLVGDKAKLTADEIEKVKESVKAVNPGSTVVVDDKGNATVTTPEGKTATIPATQLVKDVEDIAAKNNGDNINLDFEKETVVDFNNLTDAEKEAAKAKIKGANADVEEVIFDKAGNATVITKDGKVYTIVAKDIFRQKEVPTLPGNPANNGTSETNGNSNAQGTNTKLGQRLANTGTTETNTGLAGLGLGILGGLLAAARRRKNDKN